MPVTILDLILLGVMLISGLLAMVRGFMREILSIAAGPEGRVKARSSWASWSGYRISSEPLSRA